VAEVEITPLVAMAAVLMAIGASSPPRTVIAIAERSDPPDMRGVESLNEILVVGPYSKTPVRHDVMWYHLT